MKRQIMRMLVIGLLGVQLSSCSIADLTSTVKGSHYLSTGDYRAGTRAFQDVVRTDPQGAAGHYYLGRFLLADTRTKMAIKHLRRAVELSPDNADYQFWLGLAYGESGDMNQERVHYQKALTSSPSHIQATLYLGHLDFREGRSNAALKRYDQVLKRIETNPSALYNRALILHMQGDKKKARAAWQKYLKYYPAGLHASRAVTHLNELGDFSWRNHSLGIRRLTLKEVQFQKHRNSVSITAYPSLRLVAKTVANLERGVLQVVVYDKGNSRLAQSRASTVKNKILEFAPHLSPDRVQISWFGTSQVIRIGNNTFRSQESVQFFLTDWKNDL